MPRIPDFSGPCPVLHFAPTYKVFKKTVLTIPLTLNNHLHRLSPRESLPVKFIARVDHVTGTSAPPA